ncbi:MAG: UDP-3-O-(3-hydroxymyristoyl)glucosamine N-acyltransferase [Bacteroidetes bacterium GWF2_49_14]|nr:MAG: UDP-3-O-(3-hydroxymyristoyl)glucosamine N-acyltransferase [Bacteroidetes bacterium GWF2_49_14]HBB93436.1 UDP-3-O-(3-hydroxymyristoyl)glucosamine N-acyltransferase [Bacteroidales bacterium]
MEFTAQQIAGYLGGRVEGNAEARVNDVSRIEDGRPGTLSFLANMKYQDHLYKTKASVVLVHNDFVASRPLTCTLVMVDDPYRALAKLLTIVEKRPNRTGIEPMAFVHEEAVLGSDVYVGAFSYVSKGARIGNNVKIFPQVYISEDVVIGDDTWLYSGARVHNGSVIGSHCIIHSGAVIGGDGFGFAPVTGSDFTKVPQVGNVVIEDYVEIGTNTTIDRATIGSTIIRKGVKLDNLIQIAHNVEIGENTVIAAQTGISGSTRIGKNCMIGGQVGIIGHINIADGTRIAAQSGIGQSVRETGTAIQGSPAFDLLPYQRSYVLFRKLPDLAERLRRLEKNSDSGCKE